MINEILFFVITLLSLGFVAGAALFGRMWIYMTVIVLTLACLTLVGKLVVIFGFTVSVATPLFAGIFLATDVLSEFYGKASAKRAVWLSFAANVSFTGIGLLALPFEGGIQPEMDQAIDTIFRFLPRAVLAGMIAFVTSQYFDVWFYHRLKEWTKDKHLWLRNLTSTSTSQLLDSTLFVLIAFGPIDGFVSIIISAWAIKVLVAFIDTPFIYGVREILQRYPRLRDWDTRLLTETHTTRTPHI